MEAKCLKFSKHRQIIVISIDLLILVFVSIVLNVLFCHQLGANHSIPYYLKHIFLMIICGLGTQLLYRTYNSLWRYAYSKEYMMLLLGGITGYILFLLLELLMPGKSLPGLYSLSVYALYVIGMLMLRLGYRQYRAIKMRRKIDSRIPVAIIGAGEAGVKLLEELRSNPHSRYLPVCFIDDNENKIGKRVHNIEIKGPISQLRKIVSKGNIREIVIAIPSISISKQQDILEKCANLNCKVQILPDNLAFLETDTTQKLWSNVRDIQLEELLGRKMVSLDTKDIEQFLYQKVVLVTGGGGTIGSELCRQIAKARPNKLIILDNYENNAYEIQMELIKRYGKELDIYVEIATIRDSDKVNHIFRKYRPHVVFHAAAHKHVPLMEDCPEEAIQNNIFGTYHLVMAAEKYQVQRFVLISTDKAVNPTNIMGASKRFCEMMLQSMKENSKTEFVAVRFGNVLGSNGSVIPLFQKQIAEGGPITITDKRIVRYFMTVTEAAQLVLKAGAMAKQSEIYVLDMGKPVKILDLAENLIRLSGYIPYKDIDIVEIGLRPGEKLYEEILTKSGELVATANNKIFIEIQKDITRESIQEGLAELTQALSCNSRIEIKNRMKQLVPTYRDPSEVNAIAEKTHYMSGCQ